MSDLETSCNVNLSKGSPSPNITQTTTADDSVYNFLIQNYFTKAENRLPKKKKDPDPNKVFSDKMLGDIWDFEKPVRVSNFIENIIRVVHAWPDRAGRPQYNHILAVYAQATLRGSKLLDQTIDKLLEGNLENLSIEQMRSILPKDKQHILNGYIDGRSIGFEENGGIEKLKQELKPYLAKAVKKGKFKYTSEQEEKFYTYDDYKTHQFLALIHDVVEDKHLTIEQLERIAKSGGKENKYLLRAIKLLPYLDKNKYVNDNGVFVIEEDKAKETIRKLADYYLENQPNRHVNTSRYDIENLDYVEIIQYKAGYSDEIVRRMEEDNLSGKEKFLVLDVKEIDQNHNKSSPRNEFDKMRGKKLASSFSRGYEISSQQQAIIDTKVEEMDNLRKKSRTNILKYNFCVDAIRKVKASLKFCMDYTCTGLANVHFNSYEMAGMGFSRDFASQD
ncbi:MAG: hypothetical protein SFT90_01715, partial [Rickettsiales bacterium]|nr:hypothetical protein [Rickettsiales bacterium]